MDTISSFQEGPSEAPLSPGAELGRYRVLSVLGEGGMGQVYLAEHLDLGRRAALKVLRRELCESAEVARRFIQEARLVNEINHPNIVEIFDFGREPDGLLYYVMEELHGRNLSQARADGGPFTLARACAVLQQMAAALAAVHEKGVVHRDIKPENVILVVRPDCPAFVKVLDFGAAKLSRVGITGAAGTQLGLIIGTPAFMSPEQSGGRPVDSRSDLYSLGVLAYWMLADRLPFDGASFGEIVAQRESGPPPELGSVAASGERIPAALAAIVRGCLVKDPERRIQSAAEVAERLSVLDLSLGGQSRIRALLEWAAPRRALVAGGAIAALLCALAIGRIVQTVRSRRHLAPPAALAAPRPPIAALPSAATPGGVDDAVPTPSNPGAARASASHGHGPGEARRAGVQKGAAKGPAKHLDLVDPFSP